MKRFAIVICALVLLPMSLTAVVAEKPTEAAKSYRLYVPYSKLDGLSGTQKQEIGMIEADYRERIDQLEAEKHEKIHALLTVPQKDALVEMDEARKAKNRERARQYRERKKAEAKAKAEAAN